MLARKRSLVSWMRRRARGRGRSRCWRGSRRPPAGRPRSRRRVPWLASSCVEAVDAAELDDLEQLLARVGEVLAEVAVRPSRPAAASSRVEQVGDQRHAAAAAGAGPGAGLDAADAWSARCSRIAAQIAPLRDVVAGADLRRRRRARRRRAGRAALPPNSSSCGRSGSGLPLRGSGEQRRVRARVADQDAAEQAACRRG